MPKKYPDELKARAIELVLHAQSDPDTARGTAGRVAAQLDLNRETLRSWVAAHKKSGATTVEGSLDLESENRKLRAELAESRRANKILKRASAFFAAAPTDHSGNRRLHRRQPSGVRCRADRAGAGKHCCAYRNELLLRFQITGYLGQGDP